MNDWAAVKRQFVTTRAGRDFATLVVGVRPEVVVQALERHGRDLDRGGFAFWNANNTALRDAAIDAAQQYLGVGVGQVALTYNTSMGLAQVIGGIRIKPGQEILVSANEHPANTETVRLRARRDGTPFREVRLYRDSQTITDTNEVTQNLLNAIRPWTRVLSLGWVYSSDGVKLPIESIAEVVTNENRYRTEEDRLLFVVDAVHGFGIEADTFDELGCDFLIAGCHKLLGGPRGTGLICGKVTAWNHVVPWVAKLSAATRFPACDHMPGGMRVYENTYGLTEAFEFHRHLGQNEIANRLHGLATYLKSELSKVPVNIRTPPSPEFSSGMVCFDIGERPSSEVVDELFREYGIVASSSAWDFHEARQHVRLTVSLAIDEGDIDALVKAIEKIRPK